MVFFQTIDDLKKNQIQLNTKIRKRNGLLIKILKALRLINTEELDKQILELSNERQRLLGQAVKVTSDYLEYFRTETKNVLDSNIYLTKENESRLLNLLNEFRNGIQDLGLDKDIPIQTPDLLSELTRIRSFIANYNVEFEKKIIKEQLLELKTDVLQAETEYDSLFYGQFYFSKKELYDWKARWGHLVDKIEEYTQKAGSEVDFKKSLTRLIDVYNKGEDWLKFRNHNFVEKEAAQFKSFFERVPLTEEQKKAIITDEIHTLVVAGAGTGKTSTIVGKAGYLLQKGLAKPDEILLLSFNSDVAKELEKRLSSRGLQATPLAKTYHSFGLQIIANVTQIRPSVCKLAQDRTEFAQKTSEFISNRMKDPSFARMINEYFLYYIIPYKSDFEFHSFGEYVRYLKQFDLRSMNGDRVKSFEECYIANFLFVNGIDYKYEDDYEIPTADENYRQYKPDFHLLKNNIYIEHFGVDRNGKPAPFIPEAEYTRQMTWKKSIHAQHGTTLIQTFSYEQKEGTLLTNLEKKLHEKGVVFAPMPANQIFEKLNNLGRVNQFPELLCNFLNLYKSSGKTIDQIERNVDQSDGRTKTFLNIFSAIYKDYTEYLQKTGEIDFNDMLNDATKYLKEGKYRSNFKYILVDEFQDISQSRYLFLKALLEQNKSKLFCVGDDWQSIYRFTGSDISLMADFENEFNFNEKCFLQETFRFNNRLCDFSTHFILQNPFQIKKSIISKTQKEKPAVSVIRAKTADAVNDIIKDLAGRSEKPETVYVVGRYNRLEQWHLDDLPPRFGNLSIEYTTAHSSKGLEADYVIIVGLTGGKLGFPCQITDDPILNLVLAKGDTFPNAEERRLFYVAVTRARQHVFLIDDPEFNSSSFIIETLNGTYDVEQVGQLSKTALCPVCGTGEIVPIINEEYGNFYSCSNYPYCDYRPKMCPSCKKGYLHKGDYISNSEYVLRCSNNSCSFKAEICPRCNTGYLVRRESRGGYFFGCSNYPRCEYKRRYSSEHDIHATPYT